MPGAAGAYLPPVIAQLVADADQFVAKMEMAKAMLADFARSDATAHLNVDVGGVAGAAAGGGLLGLLAGAGAGRGGAGLLSLLWGRSGGILGFGAGMAGLGTLGSFAGFGPEHLLMTLLGLGGSAAGGAIGGGLLGLGALGTMGVGMGSDMAVGKSTLTDTRSLYSTYQNLAQAVQLYGANSAQAAAAQGALNNQVKLLGGAGAVGVAAEMRLAQAALQFNAVWDKVTQAARAAFVNNLAMPALQMAQGYLPLIGAAATRNFNIIGMAIRPLFAFLAGPGHQIFTDLENVFARDLPIGTGIFVQSLELILRTMDHIATTANFGSFLQRILNFVTRLNGAGFNKFMGQVDSMIRLFHVWAGFVGVLGRDIVDMFSQSLGLGTSIIQSLTGMLAKLGEWERSTQGKAAMHNVFEAHKQEIVTLMQLIPPLVVSLGRIYLTIAPTMTRVATAIAGVVVKVVDFLTHLKGGGGAVMSWVIGLGLIEAKAHVLGNAFNVFSKVPGLIKGASAAFNAFRASSLIAAVGMGPVLIAIAALIVIGVLLVTHWNQVKATAMAVWGFIGPYVKQAIAAVSQVIKNFVSDAQAWWQSHKTEVMQVWSAIATFIKTYVKVVVDVITGGFKILAPFIKTAFDLVVNILRTAWDTIKTVISVALDLVTGHWKKAWTDLKNGLGSIIADIIRTVTQFGKDIVSGIVNGIKSAPGAIAKALGDMVGGALSGVKKLLGIGSPSLVFAMMVGLPISQGVALGIKQGQSQAVSALAGVAAAMRRVPFSTPVGPRMGGGFAMAGAGAGGGQVTIHAPITLTIHGGGTAQQNATALQKVLDRHTATLVKALKGGAYLPGQGL